MTLRIAMALALLSGTGCGPLIPQVADSGNWTIDGDSAGDSEPGTTTGDASDGTTAAMTTTDPDGTASEGSDTEVPPPEDECWDIDEFFSDPDRSPAQALAALEQALVMAGSPSHDGVEQIALDGTSEWSYGGFFPEDQPLDVLEVLPRDDGSVVIAGQLYAPEYPSRRGLWIAELGVDGSLAWQEVLGSIHFMAGVDLDVQAHPAGGLVVSSHDSLDEGASPSLVTYRLDDDGQTVWSRVHELPGEPPIAINWSMGAMELLPGGDIVQLTSAVDGLRVVRTTADGDEVWDQTYATATWPQDLVALPDGDVLVLSMDENEAELMRLDPEGAVEWQERYHAGPASNFSAMAWDSLTERLLAVGSTSGEGTDTTARTWAAVLDGEGIVHWSHVGEAGSPSQVLDLLRAPAVSRFVFSTHGLSLYLGTIAPCRT